MTVAARIRRDIADRITGGDWPPGTRVPGEVELATRYGCARATVGKAMTALADAGLVDRRKRAGTVVARPRVRAAVLEIPDIAALVAARGQAYRFVLHERRQRNVRSGDAEAGLGGGGPYLDLTGVHLADEVPLCLELRAIRLETVPEAAAADFSATAPGSWLLARVAWSHARHRIRAASASASDARLLSVAKGTALLGMERWTWRGDVGVTHVRQLFPGDRYDVVADFDRITGPGSPTR